MVAVKNAISMATAKRFRDELEIADQLMGIAQHVGEQLSSDESHALGAAVGILLQRNRERDADAKRLKQDQLHRNTVLWVFLSVDEALCKVVDADKASTMELRQRIGETIKMLRQGRRDAQL